jgi:dephospho-CoA kinase
MLKVGLTGGIASGKSTVASMLRDRGCPVLEMDPLGHELLRQGEAAYDEVVREFGREVLGADGSVDRGRLGAAVFADATKRERLNAILHPPILERVRGWFAELERPGGPEFAVAEAALIFESEYNKELDRTVVCWCPAEQQISRLEERGFSLEQAQARLAAQMPIDEKRKLADEVIDCSKSLQETERQVGALVEKLKQLATPGRNISRGSGVIP